MRSLFYYCTSILVSAEGPETHKELLSQHGLPGERDASSVHTPSHPKPRQLPVLFVL